MANPVSSRPPLRSMVGETIDRFINAANECRWEDVAKIWMETIKTSPTHSTQIVPEYLHASDLTKIEKDSPAAIILASLLKDAGMPRLAEVLRTAPPAVEEEKEEVSAAKGAADTSQSNQAPPLPGKSSLFEELLQSAATKPEDTSAMPEAGAPPERDDLRELAANFLWQKGCGAPRIGTPSFYS